MKQAAKRRRKRMSKRATAGKNTFVRMAIISSRGQVTIPQDIRDLMCIRRGSVVGFEPTQRGVLMIVMKVEPEEPYTEKEWQKIEELAKGKGKVYHSPNEAKKHVSDL